MVSDNRTVNHFCRAIGAKIEALRAPLLVKQWHCHLYPATDTARGAAEALALAPSAPEGWEVVSLPYIWSSLDGEAWFRTRSELPAEVEGISLAGSRLELDILLPLGATIYVNGATLYSEPSWADTRAVPLLLAEAYRPDSPLTLAVRCNQGDGLGVFLHAELRCSALADTIFELDLIRAQMTFTHFLLERRRASKARARAWERAAAMLDLDALAASDWGTWWASVERARVALAPFAEEAKSYTVHLVAHSHIDMNWLWPMRETIEVCRRDFVAADQLMATYPEFHFSQSQAATYRAMEQDDPALFERIRTRVAEGRWDVTASTWVEGDLNMAGGEALARQLLHARRYVAERFGVVPLICWEPDTFGHNATWPQLLAKSGIRYYYFCRAGKRHPLFWWEALDGSRVLAVQDPTGYGGTVTPEQVVASVANFVGACGPRGAGLRRGLYVYGVGDHGGGGTARDVEAARRINAASYLPQVELSSTTAFYQGVLEDLQALPRARQALPVVRGELNTVFEGCYTSHGDIKRLNRQAENSLLTAETAATLATILAGAPYPLADLAEAWRTTCFHQFHDILCGCAVGVTYREARQRMAEVLTTAARVSSQALRALAAAVDTRPSPAAGVESTGPCLVVFNPLAWERDDLVRVPLQQLGGLQPAWVMDDSGRRLPVQVSDDELLFVAEKLPALGVRIYYPLTDGLQANAEAEAPALTANPQTVSLDNGILGLRVHSASGALDQLVDHVAGRDLAGPQPGWGPEARITAGMLNRLQILWEQPHPMSAWNIGDITRVDNLITGAQVRVAESGPVRGVIEVKRTFLNSALTQRICLYRRLRRVDFETEVEWHERGSAHRDAPMLRAIFAPALGYTRATFEIPFAGLERPADGNEVPALRWADLSEEGYGLSLLNDCKYGHQAHGNTLGLTLLRASYEPDANPDEGYHRFTYALYPHPGDWREAGTPQQAAQLNQPVLAAVSDIHPGPLQPGQPWLACQGTNVLISALKLAEDQPASSKAVIARLYEAHGRPARITLRPAWPVLRAKEVNLIEQELTTGGAAELLPQTEGGIQLSFTPHEIKTVKLWL